MFVGRMQEGYGVGKSGNTGRPTAPVAASNGIASAVVKRRRRRQQVFA